MFPTSVPDFSFQVVAVATAMILVDRAGRKILLFVSTLVACLSLFALAVYFYLDENLCEIPTDCNYPGITDEILGKLKWAPVVSAIMSVIYGTMILSVCPFVRFVVYISATRWPIYC
jgi:hypothetical protein